MCSQLQGKFSMIAAKYGVQWLLIVGNIQPTLFAMYVVNFLQKKLKNSFEATAFAQVIILKCQWVIKIIGGYQMSHVITALEAWLNYCSMLYCALFCDYCSTVCCILEAW